jgi:hypothetical protein
LTEKQGGKKKIAANKAQGPVAQLNNIAKLGSDIEILTDQPLPHLDTNELKAYAAKMTSGKGCFAIVCENFLVPQTFLTSKFSQLANMNIVRIVAAGVVYWPPEQCQRYVFVYQDTLGKPILPTTQPQALGMKHERLMNAIIKPLVILMLELRDADLVHGGIRASNIYDGNAANYDNILLGEALSAPPTYHQPSIYMPVEKAMIEPYARGPSTFSDDIFALGITILTLLRKEDPFTQMDEAAVIRQRIELGTYSFFTTHQRNTGPLMELIRGTLHDDWQQRWTIEEVLAWMDGKRLSPKKGAISRLKATRAFDYEGAQVIRPELLTYELQFNPKAAKKAIVSDGFETWIKRSLTSARISSNIVDAQESASKHGQDANHPDRLLSKTITALHPNTPLIYKDVRAMPEGLGYLAAYLTGKRLSLNALDEIISYNLVDFWCSLAGDTEVDTSAIKSRFESAQINAKQRKLGYGMEGNLYYLCPECPCLSDLLTKYIVRSPEDLLYAFEDICSKSHKADGFLDNHIAGFLMARDKKIIEDELPKLNSKDMYIYKSGLLSVFANIQERGGMAPLPNLANALVTNMSPLLNRFHDKELQQEIRRKAEAAAQSGDIPKLSQLVNDIKTRNRDKGKFVAALHEYIAINEEQSYLEEQLEFNPKFGQGTGVEIAAIVAGIIAAVVILASTFLQYTKGGIF